MAVRIPGVYQSVISKYWNGILYNLQVIAALVLHTYIIYMYNDPPISKKIMGFTDP